MIKGQNTESVIKTVLKFYKVHENSISTFLGGAVILVVALVIFNYFKATNLKTWQNLLQDQDNTLSTSTETKLKIEGVVDTYIVKKGDDLWHISEKYYKSGYNYVDIIKANKLSNNGLITEGMRLTIPDVQAKKITVAEQVTKGSEGDKPQVVSNQPTNVVSQPDTYTTVKGDSLWKVAVKVYGDGYAWVRIYQLNKKVVLNPNVLYAGLKLNLPKLK